jgi:Putative porin
MPLNSTAIAKGLRLVRVATAACIMCTFGSFAARAEDVPTPETPAAAKPATPSAMVNLINRLAQRGVLTKEDAADLAAQAEADAADARVQAAEAQLAAARAEAAAARARAEVARTRDALVAAQAANAQLAANQAAAVQALLGKPMPAPQSAPVPAAPVNEGSAVSEPVADEPRSSAPVAAAPSPRSEAAAPVSSPAPVAAPSAPSPAPDLSSPDAVAAAAAAAMTPRAAPPEVVAPEAPADQSAPAAAAEQAAVVRNDSPPASVPEASPAPADNLTRNEEGAIVVPQDDSASRTPAAVVPKDLPDSSPDTTEAAAPAPAADSDAAKGQDAAVTDSSEKAAPAEEAPAAVSDSAGGSAPQVTESSGPSGPPTTAAEAPAAPEASEAPVGNVPVASATTDAPDDVVRVAYVPDVIKNQIREEVKNEVIAEARKENWGSPSAGPEWVSKFTLYGDVRIRAEEIINHAGNNNTGAFPDFNAINTGAPFDTAGNVFSPQYDVDQNRNRERIRARLGATVDMKGGFTAGLRIATGNDDDPVTENQTIGAAGSAQGGDFSKYSIWLDRAYIKYQSSGDPSQALSLYFGRFENLFFSTTLIWANDIGFDGFAAKIPIRGIVKSGTVQDFKPFLVVGAFPIFDTDLNYATNQPAKYASYDKWLFAGQLGFDAKLNDDLQLKAAGALYQYRNIQGQLSDPFTPLTTSDAGDTDASRPSFAQNGNTYMQIRDITPGPLNDNGTIDQFQYYGLAAQFKELAFTEGLYYDHFEPFEISLVSEWVKNLAFNQSAVAAVAVNNGGPTGFIGGNTGWMTTLKFGDKLISEAGDWNVSVGYRKVESDAVVDGFNDADFGGALTGTNLKGFTLTAAIGISTDVWIEGRWFSASAIAGPIYRNDLLQLDLNAKF